MIKDVDKYTVKTIFNKAKNNKEQTYIIPPYQRAYAWGKNQWAEFFDDINNSDGEYFLGSIICINEDEQDKSNEVSINLVIDGQQRLTTISILLLAIYDKINRLLESEEILKKTKEVAVLQEEIQGRFFFDKKISLFDVKPEKKPRLTLSLQNNNSADYIELISEVTNENKLNSPPKNHGNRRIKQAYNHFFKQLDELCDEENVKYNLNNVFKFYTKLSMAFIVKITVDDASSAFILFESLNNRGMELTPIDLIKTKVIEKKSRDDGYTPDKVNEQWQVIIDNISDKERYLRHYYHAFIHKDEVGIDDIKRATKSNLIKIYSKIIDDKKKFDFVYYDLIKKSKVYGYLTNPDSDLGDREIINICQSKCKDKLKDLSQLGVAQAYILLLFLLDKWEDEDYYALLNYLENWFLVRHLTNYPATNKLDAIFMDLIEHIKDDEIYSFDTIKAFLDNYRAKQELIFEILTQEPLYDNNAKALRYLLVKIEKSKRTYENKVDFWEKRKGNDPIWSVEHIYPQKPKKGEEKEMLELHKHKLGNLTLTCYNGNLSNSPYKDKLNMEQDKKNVGLASGNVFINDYIKTKFDNGDENWTEQDINERGKMLANYFLELIKQ